MDKLKFDSQQWIQIHIGKYHKICKSFKKSIELSILSKAFFHIFTPTSTQAHTRKWRSEKEKKAAITAPHRSIKASRKMLLSQEQISLLEKEDL